MFPSLSTPRNIVAETKFARVSSTIGMRKNKYGEKMMLHHVSDILDHFTSNVSTSMCPSLPTLENLENQWKETIFPNLKEPVSYTDFHFDFFTGRYQSITMLTCSNCFPKSKMVAHQRIHRYALGTVTRSSQVILGEDMASFQIFRYYSI
jgi:hypothetical protein